MVLALVAWALFGFAGAYRWTVLPLAAGAGVLVALAHARPGGGFRILDGALTACLLVAGAQLLPLPAALRLALAPRAEALDRALLLNLPADPFSAPARPLSIDPAAGAWALTLGATLILIFWGVRACFERAGGLRLACRAVAWYGLVLAAVVFLQRVLSPRLIYGFWRPIARVDDPRPIGPFLNRNDLATWFVIAVPIVLGYALARLHSRDEAGRIRVASVADARMMVLIGSLVLMVAALLASESRSGLAGLGAALALLLALARRRLAPGRFKWLAAGLAALVVGATAYANVPALSARLSDSIGSGLGGRLQVWRETWPMVRDFPWTGIGVGGFARGMSVYQQSPRLLFFNHAHNEYLQLLVEGGVFLFVPAALAAMAGALDVVRRLRRDRTPVFWIRAGAAAGMTAAAVQSVWNTGLRMPASGVLFAVAAGVALHQPARAEEPASGPDVPR